MEAQDIAVVRPPSSSIVYRFRDGRPYVLEVGGRRIRLDFADEPTIEEGMADLWEGAEEEALEVFRKKWPGRFAPFYGNPNKSVVLLASFFLVFFWLFLYAPRPASSISLQAGVMALGLVGTIVFGWLVLKTGARAGTGGAALGALLIWSARFLKAGGRWRIAAVGLLGVLALAFLLLGGKAGRLTGGFNDRGNRWRMETWSATPQMMVDSPWGWPSTSGRAYADWYQPLKSDYVTPTLTSDHLTYMVGWGWIGRFLWAFVWFGLLAVLGRSVFKGVSPLPLALFSAFAFSAMFNPLMHDWTLWLVPLGSMGLFLYRRPWRDWRLYRLPAVVSAALSIVVCASFYFCGRVKSAAARPPIRTDGNCVFVGTAQPDAWIVDDRATIGWLFAPKEIRSFYRASSDVPSLGYAEKFDAVPKKVRRLAIASGRCREYIDLWRRGKAPKADDLIFLSPAMPLEDVPVQLRKSCRFRMVVGEFAARYVNNYGPLPVSSDEVVVSKGAEVYLPNWIGYTLGMRELIK